MDDLNRELLFHEHVPESTREFLLSNYPPERRSVGGFELTLRLLKHLEAPLEDSDKVQLLIDPLRVAGALGFEQNSLIETVEFHVLRPPTTVATTAWGLTIWASSSFMAPSTLL